MELVEGQSLDRLIPDGGLPVDRILQIAAALADALAAAHDKGIVHRDLKPANVMMPPTAGVKVLDFGLAKEIACGDRAKPTVTAAGSDAATAIVMGTPAYMSPEQVAGRPLDHRTDIFSLGILLYEMASGRRPFEGASSIELASAILRDTPPPLSDLAPICRQTLARLIRQLPRKGSAATASRRRATSGMSCASCRDNVAAIAVPRAHAHPARAGRAPRVGTRASGSRCCRSNTPAATPI